MSECRKAFNYETAAAAAAATAALFFSSFSFFFYLRVRDLALLQGALLLARGLVVGEGLPPLLLLLLPRRLLAPQRRRRRLPRLLAMLLLGRLELGLAMQCNK